MRAGPAAVFSPPRGYGPAMGAEDADRAAETGEPLP
jgi:hypothetical protein